MIAAERVMGNLQAMTPLERSVARKIFPFYGWTKHILKYVLTYPVDHPWRAMFLSMLATQNTDTFSSGLDDEDAASFLSGPTRTKGNVSAIDVRALDPFRDVANYATLGGWICSLNPIVSAPFATIDPEIIYGGEHPPPPGQLRHLLRDQRRRGGRWWAQRRRARDPRALRTRQRARSVGPGPIDQGHGRRAPRTIFEGLGYPIAQVQHFNLQQIWPSMSSTATTRPRPTPPTRGRPAISPSYSNTPAPYPTRSIPTTT